MEGIRMSKRSYLFLGGTHHGRRIVLGAYGGDERTVILPTLVPMPRGIADGIEPTRILETERYAKTWLHGPHLEGQVPSPEAAVYVIERFSRNERDIFRLLFSYVNNGGSEA
jgi:hypothetical protein